MTIGIPVYRAVDYIEETIASALAQTYEGLEVLVVDDCGGDGSVELVERQQKVHPRGYCLRILRNERNQGVGPTRNRIIDEARGRWLFFLDSDDTIVTDAIYTLHREAVKTQAEVVYGSMERRLPGTTKPVASYRYPYRSFVGNDQLAAYVFAHHGQFQSSVCNALYDVSFLRSSGVRFGDARFWEDTTFTYSVVLVSKKAVLIPEMTYCYHQRAGSLSNYQERSQLPKQEVLSNVDTIDKMKLRYAHLTDKIFMGDYCYTIQSYSFYIVCYVLKHRRRISPKLTGAEMHSIMQFPVSLRTVCGLAHRRMACLLLWVLARLPVVLQIMVLTAVRNVLSIRGSFLASVRRPGKAVKDIRALK